MSEIIQSNKKHLSLIQLSDDLSELLRNMWIRGLKIEHHHGFLKDFVFRSDQLCARYLVTWYASVEFEDMFICIPVSPDDLCQYAEEIWTFAVQFYVPDKVEEYQFQQKMPQAMLFKNQPDEETMELLMKESEPIFKKHEQAMMRFIWPSIVIKQYKQFAKETLFDRFLKNPPDIDIDLDV